MTTLREWIDARGIEHGKGYELEVHPDNLNEEVIEVRKVNDAVVALTATTYVVARPAGASTGDREMLELEEPGLAADDA